MTKFSSFYLLTLILILLALSCQREADSNKNKTVLRVFRSVRFSAQYTDLPGMSRNAGSAAGFKQKSG